MPASAPSSCRSLYILVPLLISLFISLFFERLWAYNALMIYCVQRDSLLMAIIDGRFQISARHALPASPIIAHVAIYHFNTGSSRLEKKAVTAGIFPDIHRMAYWAFSC